MALQRSSQYQKHTHYEHIRKRPDSYLGSVEARENTFWVMGTEGKMESKDLSFVPALYKIFDEIVVNAADNKVRDASMDTIKVTLDDDGTISVYNNGKGIPVELHPEHGIYTPELIFGHLLTSSNYDDSEQRITGGRNGYGAKLTNIFSQKFTVETYDKEAGKRYRQTWTNNMQKKGKHAIKEMTAKQDYTRITFKPDYESFGLTTLDDNHRQLFTRRIYDLTATLRGVSVYLNGTKLPVKSFKDYVQLFVGREGKVIYEKVNDRWEVAVAANDSGQFQQVSFVNSINTVRGGTHVDYVTRQITDAIMEKIKKTSKTDNVGIKAYTIKNNMWLFVNCFINNPSFDSQTKETLTSVFRTWGTECKLGEPFFKKLFASDVMQATMEAVQSKQDQLLKKTDGSKKRRITGIPKLDDANEAGTKKSRDCTLFLTEGDSAKSTAVAGISALPKGRDLFGVYPLRGKIMNVRDANKMQIAQNKEICELKEILGLQNGKVYTDTSSLRYGRIALFTDADNDGSHIKGLIINFFDTFFPSLLALPGFLTEFITPIVKCTRASGGRDGQRICVFYTLQEYEEWKTANNDGKGWTIKYYKGLGTSTTQEAKEYFRAIADNLKSFQPVSQSDRERIDMVFNKKRADDRKAWLKTYQPKAFLDRSQPAHSVSQFIDQDLIHFSSYDNVRNIPRMIDGLKPSQRKILYTLFKRPDKMKVAQLGGQVSALTAYHHGEQSLFETVIKLAHDFVGSNNLNLLVPDGQFGTRRQGGADAASPRYIYTCLQKYTRHIFHPDDDPILQPQLDDGIQIEPETYYPIIPMILVNGTTGIGSGYSTDVLPHNPLDVIELLRAKLLNQSLSTLEPFFRGFKGSVEHEGGGDTGTKWTVRGKWELKDDGKRLIITELPIGVWTDTYKQRFLEPDVNEKKNKVRELIKEYREYHTEQDVHFDIELQSPISSDEVSNLFKLESSLRTSNMVLFDADYKLKKYESVDKIVEEYFVARLEAYQKRKDYWVAKFESEVAVLFNKLRFIQMILDEKITIRHKSKTDIENLLQEHGFLKQDDHYEYLLSMQLWSLTKERYEQLANQHAKKTAELEELKLATIESLWLKDLNALEKVLNEVPQTSSSESQSQSVSSGKGGSAKMKAGKVKRSLSDTTGSSKRLANAAKRSKLAST